MNANQQQSEAWNGAEAAHYVDHADRYDRQLAPFANVLFERVQLEPHHSRSSTRDPWEAWLVAAA